MRILIVIIILPFFVQSQQPESDKFGSSNVEGVNTMVKFNKNDKSWMLNITGSKFYHNEFIPTILNGKKIKVKYDAFDDYMRLQVGPNLFTYPKNEILLLENKESWISHGNSWFKILFENNGFKYLLKPTAKFYPAEKASEYSERTPPKFKINYTFYSLKDDNIILLKRREIKKMGLKKMLEY